MSENDEKLTFLAYKEALKDGKLVGSKCTCGKTFVPPKKICNACQSIELKPIEFCGKGTLATYSQVHVGARYFANQGYAMRKPYCFGVVKLEEGPSISAHIVGDSQEFEYDSSNFSIGMKLKMKILKVEDNFDLGFEPDI